MCTDPAVTELLCSKDNDSTLLPWNPTESRRRERDRQKEKLRRRVIVA